PTNTDPNTDGNPDDPTTTPLTAASELQVTQADVIGGSGSAGDMITYAVVVQNTGDLTVTGISVVNDVGDVDASLVCSPVEPFDLAPGASVSCIGTHTITQADLDAGQIVSSAEATGTDPGGSSVVDLSDDPNITTNIDPDADGEPDDPTVSILTQSPSISLTNADVFDGTVVAGNTVDYVLTVVNTGNVTLSTISLTDSLVDANLAIDCSPVVLPAALAPGESLICTTTHSITQSEIDARLVTNTATVSAEDPDGASVVDDSDDPADGTNIDPNGDGEPDDPTVTPLPADAQLEVTNVDILAGSGLVGDTITYTITTTNTGALTLDNIDLTNSLADADASIDCGPTVLPSTLAPGASLTCTAVHTLVQADLDAGSVVSSVTADATDPSGTPVSDISDDPDESANVDTEADGEPDDPTVTQLPETNALQVIMTASAPTTAGEGDPIDYTIVVVNSGLTTLTGLDIAGAGLDAGSINCSPDTLPLTLAPGATLTCVATHTITAADLAAEQVIGSATATALSPGGTPIADISDDPTDPTDVDTEGDGEPDDPTVTTLLKPIAGANTIVVNEPADPSRPIVADVTSDDTDPDGSIDPTSVNILGGTDLDGDGALDQLIVSGEGTWTVDRVIGTITFVPESGFTNNPTPVLYTVADDQGIVSQPGELAIDYPPAAVDDTSLDNPFGTRVVVNVVSNDTVGDAVLPATLQLVGGVDTDGDGFADELVVAGEGVWRTNNVAGRVSFKPDAGFVGDPTQILYLIEDGDGRPTQAAVVVTYQAQPTATINGTVFDDKNANGVQDAGEPDLSGVTVRLTCAGPDGVFNTADDIISSTVTASPYQLTAVVGEACIVEMFEGLGGFPIQTADPDNNFDKITTITVGGQIDNLNFGFRAAPMLSVTGANSRPMALFALLLILLGSALVVLPSRIEDWREPEYW
ncbi:MAG: hypothetical protein EX269_15030, partial [Acidimicrobiales bacterium]